jgi:hypothetical protein
MPVGWLAGADDKFRAPQLATRRGALALRQLLKLADSFGFVAVLIDCVTATVRSRFSPAWKSPSSFRGSERARRLRDDTARQTLSRARAGSFPGLTIAPAHRAPDVILRWAMTALQVMAVNTAPDGRRPSPENSCLPAWQNRHVSVIGRSKSTGRTGIAGETSHPDE